MHSSRAAARIARITAVIAIVGLVAGCGGSRRSEQAIAAAANGSAVAQAADPGVVSPQTGAVPQLPTEAVTDPVGAVDNPAAPAGDPTVAKPAAEPGGSPAGKPAKPAAPAAAPAAGPATGTPVNVGYVGTFSGPIGSLVKGQVTGAQVWAKYINDRGGVNNHPVNLIVADDAGDPARFNSLIQQLVESQNVIGFIGTTLGFAPNGNNAYLEKKKILTFSTEGGMNTAYERPYSVTPFPAGTLYGKVILGAVATKAVPAKKLKLGAIACSDFSLCDLFASVWSDKAYVESLGLTPTFVNRPSITQPDYTANCIAAKQSGADLLVFAADSSTIARFASDCARQNYHPMLGTGDIVIDASLPNNVAVDGLIAGTKIAAWTNTSVPGVATYRQALARYAPSQAPDGSTAIGWTAASFFGAAAKNLPATNPTAADLYKGLRSIKGDTLNGMTYPLDFTKGEVSPKILCFGIVAIQDKKFVSPPGPALNCPKETLKSGFVGSSGIDGALLALAMLATAGAITSSRRSSAWR